jgi:hypothetical protein
MRVRWTEPAARDLTAIAVSLMNMTVPKLPGA